MIQKNDFVTRLSKKGYSKQDAAIIMKDVITTIKEYLAEGESVMFRGFGTFEVRERVERESVSPVDGTRIKIPAYKAPHFSAGKELKRIVRTGVMEDAED